MFCLTQLTFYVTRFLINNYCLFSVIFIHEMIKFFTVTETILHGLGLELI